MNIYMLPVKNINFNVLTLNLQMYKGGSDRQEFKYEKLVNILKNNNLDVLLFQEDACYSKAEIITSEYNKVDESLFEFINKKPNCMYTEKLLKLLDYKLVNYCDGESYTRSDSGEQITLRNSIYIKSKHNVLYSNSTKIGNCVQKYKDEESKSDRCVATCKINGDIENMFEINIGTSHLCGGRFIDQTVKNNILKTLNEKIDIFITNDNILVDEISEKFEQNEEIKQIINEMKNPTIFSADFNTMHPLIFDKKKIPLYMKLNDEDIPEKYKSNKYFSKMYYKIIEKYYQVGHTPLKEIGMRPVLTSLSSATTPYNTMVDYIYYDKNKLILMDYKIVYCLDFTDHNGVIAKFKLNFMDEYHIRHQNDFLYMKTMDALKNYGTSSFNMYAPSFVNYDNNIDAKEIYNKMYYNMIDSNLTNILDIIFDKKEISKDILFFSSENLYKSNKVIEFMRDQRNDNDNDIKQFIYEENQKLHDDTQKYESIFWDIYKKKSDNRNKGAIYTTSCFDYNINNINNLELSLSTKYLGNKENSFNYMMIYKPTDTYSLYYLHPSNFKSRILFKMIITNVLMSGKFNYNIEYDELKKMYSEDSRGKTPLYVSYSYECEQLLHCSDIQSHDPKSKCFIKDPIKPTTEKISFIQRAQSTESHPVVSRSYDDVQYPAGSKELFVDKHCVRGSWDGDNTLHEYIINHFISVYNENNKNKVVGYIGLDSGYSNIENSKIFAREIVWFNQEMFLEPVGIYFKSYISLNLFDYYKVFYKYLLDNRDVIISNRNKEGITKEMISELSKKVCESSKQLYNNNFIIDIQKDIEIFKNDLSQTNESINISIGTIDTHNKILQHGGFYHKYQKYKTKYELLKNKK